MDRAAATLKCRPADLPERVSQMRDELRRQSATLAWPRALPRATDVVAAALRNAKDLGAYRCVFTKLNRISGKDLRSVWDSIRDGAKGEPVACVVASTTSDGKVALLAAGTESRSGWRHHSAQIGIKRLWRLPWAAAGPTWHRQAALTPRASPPAALDAAKAALGHRCGPSRSILARHASAWWRP